MLEKKIQMQFNNLLLMFNLNKLKYLLININISILLLNQQLWHYMLAYLKQLYKMEINNQKLIN